MGDRLIEFLESLGIAQPTGFGWMSVVLTFLLAAFATWAFVPFVRAFSLKAGWADLPNSRRINKVPVPNAGGLAVYAGSVAALILATLLYPIFVDQVQVQVLAILLGASLLVLTGFIDDQFGLPPLFRLAVQIGAALLLITTGIEIQVSFGGAWAPFLSGLITVLWVVAITNAVNLIDGVDGLAGGVSFIVGMCLLAVAAQVTEKAAATILLAGVAGAALGFLRHNFHPSSIILGDSGAYFLGFVLAASSILGNLKLTTAFGLFPTLLFLLVPVVDTAQVFLRRLLHGKNPLSTPGRDHLHHHLLRRGISQRWTALILWGVTLATNIAAMVAQGMPAVVIVMTGLGIVLLLALVVWRRGRSLAQSMALGEQAGTATELPRDLAAPPAPPAAPRTSAVAPPPPAAQGDPGNEPLNDATSGGATPSLGTPPPPGSAPPPGPAS